MTDEPTDADEAEIEQEMPDVPELPEDLQEKLQQAQQIHAQLDEAKNWAVDAATEIRTRADVLEGVDELGADEADQRRQVADIIRSIYERIEQGDSNKAKQVRPQAPEENAD